MSVQLSKDEKILRDYDYCIEKGGLIIKSVRHKKLMVTNRRVIHRTTSHRLGSEEVINYEVPVADINNVNVTYGMRSRIGCLVLGILAILAGLIAVIVGIANESDAGEVIVPMLLWWIVGAVLVLVYFKMKRYSVSFSLFSKSRVVPVLSTGGQSVHLFSRLFGSVSGATSSLFVRIVVRPEVASVMAEELGAIVRDAAAGVYEPSASDD